MNDVFAISLMMGLAFIIVVLGLIICALYSDHERETGAQKRALESAIRRAERDEANSREDYR